MSAPRRPVLTVLEQAELLGPADSLGQRFPTVGGRPAGSRRPRPHLDVGQWNSPSGAIAVGDADAPVALDALDGAGLPPDPVGTTEAHWFARAQPEPGQCRLLGS